MIEKTKLLGTIVTNDLKWRENTDSLVKKAYQRMQLLHRTSNFGASTEDLKQIYTTFIRSVLEQSCAVWHSSLTQEDSDNLERVQRSAVKLILNNQNIDYNLALAKLKMDNLSTRRNILCERKFCKKMHSK